MLQKKKKNIIFRDPSLFLERIMAVIVFIAIIFAIAALWEPFLHFLKHRENPGAFLEFIGTVFSVVIGIEFFKLLCNPGKDTLLEVLMFVVARHMIIEETSTTENLVSIITIAILFIIDRFLMDTHCFHHAKAEDKDTSGDVHSEKKSSSQNTTIS